MRCENFREIISLYIDNELNQEETIEIEKHLQVCEKCSREYEDLLTVKKLLSETPQVELPENFKIELHKKLVETAPQIDNNIKIIDFYKKPKKKFNWKMYSSIAAVFLLMIVSVAVLKNNDMGINKFTRVEDSVPESQENMPMEIKENGMMYSSDFKRRAAGKPGEFTMDGSDLDIFTKEVPKITRDESIVKEFTNSDSKIILKAHLHLGVKDHDSAYKEVKGLVDESGGYIQSHDISNKSFAENNTKKLLKISDMILRIPRNKFDNTFKELVKLGTPVSQNTSSHDITREYRYTLEKVLSLQRDEKELREALNKEKDISEVNDELKRVRKEMSKLKDSIENWDDLVELSTIDIKLEEVVLKDKGIEN
ncbi:MAG: DUF4349 domain-containing protein [Clostridia bacterium]|nr:DUF4349 domain-containing protein [Clostridia bacterium]